MAKQNTVGKQKHEDAHLDHHPTPATYVKVAAALVIITAIEVGIFYLEALGHVIIPILVVLSAAKFGLVVMFYMHLRYDHRIFSGLFYIGIATAGFIVISLMALFRWFQW